MITRVEKCSPDVLRSVASFVYQDSEFAKQEFPHATNAQEVGTALASLGNSWQVLTSERPIALFKGEISAPTANLPRLCYDHSASFETVIASLREDLRRIGVTNFQLSVLPDETDSFLSKGFEKREVLVGLSRFPIETKMMPILPLMNPTQKEIPTLSNLMYEAYAKIRGAYSDAEATQRAIRSIVSGVDFLPNASFASGAFPNLVSACLVTRVSPFEATVSQVFTHPLYRARGLATTEIASAMNILVKEGKVGRLTVWSPETNEVMKRLLDKMGFAQDRRLVEMTSRT